MTLSGAFSVLYLANDTGVIQVPEGCALEQIIFFDDNLNQIKIVKSKFQEISRLDRMALAVHELSYLYYRIQPMNVEDANWGRYRTNSSQEAREFSARLLMEDELHPKSRLLDPPYSFNSMPTRCTDDSPFENAFYSTTVDSHYFGLSKFSLIIGLHILLIWNFLIILKPNFWIKPTVNSKCAGTLFMMMEVQNR